ncbi:hypothetical protein HMPREF9440_02507 [Sutterella parvirubra YIT 11816]|uniref:Uncharacterized protein n=1 Tax=Sutterella parvirubra YIT 11816 TaxID=762967 RepID=H3KI99_9BURK|nr:hypothetical protein HMPREF9440_02507 [Sutterella parvirubra YIT 11816]
MGFARCIMRAKTCGNAGRLEPLCGLRNERRKLLSPPLLRASRIGR